MHAGGLGLRRVTERAKGPRNQSPPPVVVAWAGVYCEVGATPAAAGKALGELKAPAPAVERCAANPCRNAKSCQDLVSTGRPICALAVLLACPRCPLW